MLPNAHPHRQSKNRETYGRYDVAQDVPHTEARRMREHARHIGNEQFYNGMEKRYIVAKRRSEQGKQIRRQYKNDIGVPYQLCKGYSLMLDGYSNTITTFASVDNWILQLQNNDNMKELVYHEHPTKEQLLEYFSQRIRIRKMAPREAMRLMDVDDADIDKIMNATETVTLKNGTVKTKKAISKTAVYKLAGNSIVCSCLYHIFRTLFLPDQPENKQPIQKSLFDI